MTDERARTPRERARTPRIVARVFLSIDVLHKGGFADFAVRGQTGDKTSHRSWMLAERAFQLPTTLRLPLVLREKLCFGCLL
jgi:hypothetical protein